MLLQTHIIRSSSVKVACTKINQQAYYTLPFHAVPCAGELFLPSRDDVLQPRPTKNAPKTLENKQKAHARQTIKHANPLQHPTMFPNPQKDTPTVPRTRRQAAKSRHLGSRTAVDLGLASPNSEISCLVREGSPESARMSGLRSDREKTLERERVGRWSKAGGCLRDVVGQPWSTCLLLEFRAPGCRPPPNKGLKPSLVQTQAGGASQCSMTLGLENPVEQV